MSFSQSAQTNNQVHMEFDKTVNLLNYIKNPSDDSYSAEWPDDDILSVIATNKVLLQHIEQTLTKVTIALEKNQENQQLLLAKQHALRNSGNQMIKKIPVQRYLPPYFKDDDQMCAPHSEEGSRRLQQTTFDPLMREEKKWSPVEILKFQKAVRANLIEILTEELRAKRDELQDKIRKAGQDTSAVDIENWKEQRQTIMRQIQYERGKSDIELTRAFDELRDKERREIDWEKINNIDFNGLRRADALRLKWMNEVCPRWNQTPWTEEEIANLKQLREKKTFESWGVIANRMQTNRTPWQCFQKYHCDVFQNKREWTQEEDRRLLKLCNTLKTVNGKIQWDKVTYYMKGRSRQQVRVRYTRTLDKYIKHGPWTDQEDLLLLGAINRHGAREWSKIAKAVPCRTDIQCRERWVSVMDKRVAKEWSLDDDEKLIFLVSTYGLGNWEKCAEYLSSRTAAQCRVRYQTIINAKSRFYNARNQNLLENIGNTSQIFNCFKSSELYRDWEKSNGIVFET